MTYTPVLPAPRVRNGRVPMPPVFVRPSGEAGAASAQNIIRIVDMPRGGRLFIDGVEWMGGGHWDEDEPNVWVVPNPPNGRVLRVEDAAGVARGRDMGEVIAWRTLDTGELDWDSLEPIEGTGTGTARLFGAAVAEVRVDDLPGAFQGTPSGGALLFTLPVGDHTLRLVAPDNVRWEQRVRVLPGQTTNVPLVRPAAPPPAPSRPPAGERVNFMLPSLSALPVSTPPAVVANGSLTVLAEPGVVLAIARGSAPTVMVAPPVTVPATGGVSTPWPAGLWLLAARRPNGEVQTRPVTVVGGQAQTVDMRSGWPAPAASPGAGAGASPGATTANVTVTGGVGWVLTVTNALGAMVGRLPILSGGTVVFPLAPATYTLAVDDGAGHTAQQAITVPAAGLAVDVTPWLAAQRAATQGPPAAAGAVGSITLTGAPPGSLVRVSALSDFTTDDSGRPVLLSLPAGTHSVTVIPPGAPQRTGAATVTAGGNTPLTFGALVAPSAQTGIQEVPSIESQCGPVQSPAAWMPPTACPGQELVGPDGTRYRAVAVTGGVALAALKADGTIDTSWSTGTWVALGLAGAAAVGAAWWFYGRDSKRENPGRGRKCSCQDHD